MKNSASFQQAFVKRLQKLVARFCTDNAPDWDDWSDFMEPFYRDVKSVIDAGLVFDDYGTPVTICSMDGRAKEAYAGACVSLFPEDGDDCVASKKVPFSDIIMSQWPDDRDSTRNVIAALERSLHVAKEKFEVSYGEPY